MAEMSDVKVRGADRLGNNLRLFVPDSTGSEKSAREVLVKKLNRVVEGFTIIPSKGVYVMKTTGQQIEESTTVIDISLTRDKIPAVIALFKEYGIAAKEETILFNIDGVGYISEPSKLEVE